MQQRYQGYETALQAAGRSLEPNLLAYGDYSHTSGSLAMQRLLEQAPDLDAVFVNSDLMALGAINVLQSAASASRKMWRWWVTMTCRSPRITIYH